MINQREGIAFRRKWLKKNFSTYEKFPWRYKNFWVVQKFFSDIFQKSIVPVARQLKQNPH